MFTLWIKFFIAAAIVVFSGYRICLAAEKLAQITKLGRSFVGFMFLAVITSLPELSVTISATKIQALDLALGDLFGSNLFNLTILAIIYLAFTKEKKLFNFDQVHIISSSVSILLIALAAMGIIFYNLFIPRIGYSRMFLDLETVLILMVYIFGAYLIFHSEKNKPSGAFSFKARELKHRLRIWLSFFFYGAVLVAAAVYLSKLGDKIAQIPVAGVALGGTFVGSLLIAIITSLPELSVALSAVKLGSFDMALGNIFGSNMFNMAIIPITDLVLGRKV
ncbi:MAG: hypothetical protein JW714_00560, partial [Candidatus Omnitrophica bacterium]|nr:hypothetical protein [Candidatus Omnitrophota bacterium]